MPRCTKESPELRACATSKMVVIYPVSRSFSILILFSGFFQRRSLLTLVVRSFVDFSRGWSVLLSNWSLFIIGFIGLRQQFKMRLQAFSILLLASAAMGLGIQCANNYCPDYSHSSDIGYVVCPQT
jgi:hypothetical protein